MDFCVVIVGLPKDNEAALLLLVVLEQLAMTFDKSRLITGVVGLPVAAVTVAVVAGVTGTGTGNTVCTGCTNGCCKVLIVGGSIFSGCCDDIFIGAGAGTGVATATGNLVITDGFGVSVGDVCPCLTLESLSVDFSATGEDFSDATVSSIFRLGPLLSASSGFSSVSVSICRSRSDCGVSALMSMSSLRKLCTALLISSASRTTPTGTTTGSGSGSGSGSVATSSTADSMALAARAASSSGSATTTSVTAVVISSMPSSE